MTVFFTRMPIGYIFKKIKTSAKLFDSRIEIVTMAPLPE